MVASLVLTGKHSTRLPIAQTSVFAKVDVIFGENTDGVSGKAGTRATW
jgi:hypothetical protein